MNLGMGTRPSGANETVREHNLSKAGGLGTMKFCGKHRVRDWSRDECGSIAILFSLTAFAMMMTVGLAVDGARYYSMSTRVKASLDAAALAAGQMLDDDSYTDSDIQSRAAGYFNAHWPASARTDLSMVSPVTTVDRANFQVSVALNANLKTTFGQIAGINQFDVSRVATVAYRTKKVELALVLDTTGSMCMPCSKLDGVKAAANDVVDSMLDGTHPPGTMKIAIAPFAAAVNAGSFASTVSGGSSSDGCVVERSGNSAFTDDPATGGARLNSQSTMSGNSNYSCPGSSVLPLTEDPTVLKSQIAGLTANGGTAGHLGTAWGWYLVSPNWAPLFPKASRPRKYTDMSSIKSVLIMTDGEYNTSYLTSGQNSSDPLVTGSSSYQAMQLCNNMKAQGIQVWTVAFQSSTQSETFLRACATDFSHFFSAANESDLKAAFHAVANQLSALRISK